MDERIISLAYDILALVLPVLAILTAEWLRRKLGTERLQRIQKDLETKQELAILAVRFVEQVYKDLHGPDKYQKAAEWLAARAQEHGLKLTADEIKGLIEAALRQLKDAFGNEWAKQVQ